MIQDPLGTRITMLAEHDLDPDPAFAGPNGHIPSSQFEISMPLAVLCTRKGKLASSCPDASTTKSMVETDGIEPTT